MNSTKRTLRVSHTLTLVTAVLILVAAGWFVGGMLTGTVFVDNDPRAEAFCGRLGAIVGYITGTILGSLYAVLRLPSDWEKRRLAITLITTLLGTAAGLMVAAAIWYPRNWGHVGLLPNQDWLMCILIGVLAGIFGGAFLGALAAVTFVRPPPEAPSDDTTNPSADSRS
jgi:hypothetical protein